MIPTCVESGSLTMFLQQALQPSRYEHLSPHDFCAVHRARFMLQGHVMLQRYLCGYLLRHFFCLLWRRGHFLLTFTLPIGEHMRLA